MFKNYLTSNFYIMNKTFVLLVIALLSLAFSNDLYPQKKSFTGKVIYKINLDQTGLPDEARAMMPTTVTTYIGNDKVKTEIATMMGNQQTILDLNEKSHTTLMEVMGQKLAIKDSYEELMKKMNDFPEFRIEITNETMEIAGLDCKKVLIKKVSPDGKESTDGYAWFTDEFKLNPAFNFNNPTFKDLNGLLMDYEMMTGNNMKMKLTAVEVNKQKIKDSEFEIPSEYKFMTRQELSRIIGF